MDLILLPTVKTAIVSVCSGHHPLNVNSTCCLCNISLQHIHVAYGPNTIQPYQQYKSTGGIGRTDKCAMCRPYGFLERFDPNFTPNTTDMDGRRYTYRAQPGIGHWNCAQLANALIAAGLVPLVCFSSSCLGQRKSSPPTLHVK